MRTLLLAITIVLLSFDANSQSKKKVKRMMDSWIGATTEELYAQMGAPATVTSNGGTGTMHIYVDRVYIPSQPLPFGGGYTQATDYYKYKTFIADKNNKIYGWIVENKPNPPQRQDVNLYLQPR